MACDSLIALIERYEPDKNKRQRALDAFEEIIADYRSAIPPAVSQTRRELKHLVNALDDSINALAQLSPQSLNLFCDALDGPKGATTKELMLVKSVAEKAHAAAMALSGTKPNSDINVLAHDVAVVMKTILHMPVSLTRDTDENIKGNHGGATYASILRQVMECAGKSPPDDLFPLIKRGVDLLANPLGH